MPTVTEQIARWVSDLTFEQLTFEAIDSAKRRLYDSLGCALSGYQSRDVKAYLRHAQELGGAGVCTIIAAGTQSNPLIATLANAMMICTGDSGDAHRRQDQSHSSDLIAAAISLGERDHRSGRDLITAIVLGCEIEMRLSEFASSALEERGWHRASLTACAAPMVAGWMLGLSWQQMQHAIGISACHHFTLGAAAAGEPTSMSNLAGPMAVRSGVEAAMLAQLGYTGPGGALDGPEGTPHPLGPKLKPNALVDGLGQDFRISRCSLKSRPIEELDTRFNASAEPVMTRRRREELRSAIFALEKLEDCAKLMALTVSDR